ncbi:MAG TPA: CBS domain-containing protein [Agriterribacter sp.]|nr:CBS domain-containing protein [Agriterribacter sp.]
MNKREPVSFIMTRDVISVSENDNLDKVVHIFRKKGIRHLPVTKDGKITGMISRNDINRLTFGAIFDQQEEVDDAILHLLTIPQVMAANVHAVRSDTLIREVAEIFSDAEYHSLPVVDEGELKGIVTTTDVIRYLLDQY